MNTKQRIKHIYCVINGADDILIYGELGTVLFRQMLTSVTRVAEKNRPQSVTNPVFAAGWS